MSLPRLSRPSMGFLTEHGRMGLTIGVLITLLGALPLGGVGLYWFLTFPDVSLLAKINPKSTALIEARKTDTQDKGGLPDNALTWIPLARISPHLQRAVIVSEDASFYRHTGFDWEGIKEAMTRNWQKGELDRGGSTITQQLAKNLYLSPSKSILRKAHEALLTRAIESHVPKRRILELYLNVVEWGYGIYGAEAAARHHFGKSAGELSAEEAAVLAAILPAPRRSDPIRMTPYLLKRQRQILRWMSSESS